MADDSKSVPQLLGEVLRELPAIGKGSEMKQGAQYKYRSIEDILPVLNNLLSEKGLVPVLHEVYNVVETIRGTAKGGVMFSTRLQAHWLWVGPQGDSIMAGGAGEAADSGDKGTQKALTSAYKYMLVQTFAIATQESNAADIDHYANEEPALTPQQEREQAFTASGATLPEGWANFAEFDEAHQAFQAGMANQSPDMVAEVKAFRLAAEIPWPMSKDEMTTMIEQVERILSFDAAQGAAQSEADGHMGQEISTPPAPSATAYETRP